jgi:hypothetical protein
MSPDRYGEPDPIEDDDLDAPAPVDSTPRTPDEIRAHCAALRAVLATARQRRDAQP